MRTLQPRTWLSGLGQASRAPWWHERVQQIYNSTRQHAEAEVQPADATVPHEADAQFLQLLSQSFVSSSTFESTPPSRPLLANLPAAAELMEHAVPQEAAPYPVYDLPTFLETAYPDAGVHPRNPSYDWHRWSRSHLQVAPATSAIGSIWPPAAVGSRLPQQVPLQGQQQQGQLSTPPQVHWEAPQQLALLLQMDSHMQQRASRESIIRLAKLELAHLWYRQQQSRQRQQQQLQWEQEGYGSARAMSDASGASRGAADVRESPSPCSSPSSRSLPSAGNAAASAVAAAKEDTAAGAVDDDIFALADRKARERAAQQQLQQELLLSTTEAAAVGGAAGGGVLQQAMGGRDPLSSLPPDMQLRLRELQRRAEAYGTPRGTLADVLRNVGEAFERRIVLEGGDAARRDRYGTGGYDAAALMGAISRDLEARGARTVSGPQKQPQQQQQQQAADRALFGQARLEGGGGGSVGAVPMPYWAATSMLSYTDNTLALAHRERAAARRSAAAGPGGRESLAACVASLGSREGPATPMLALLMDYLQTKYQDLLYTWEVAARMQQATSSLEAKAARSDAILHVQAPAAGFLPAAVLTDLEHTWDAAVAAFNPATLGLGPGLDLDAAAAAQTVLKAPLEWGCASSLLESAAAAATAASHGSAAAAAAAAATAAANGDLRLAVQHALAPLLAAAAERHRALLGGGGVDVDGSSTVATAAAVGAVAGAASVVCFRETLVLDASSGFDDGSHDSRVSLEFSLHRLTASEPALGGAWGRRFLERLMAHPMWDQADPRVPAGGGSRAGAPATAGGSMAGRRRRGAAARSAAMATVFPVDISYSFCHRTGTATLTTARYGSREANRKLLLERYTELLRAAVRAAAGPTSS